MTNTALKMKELESKERVANKDRDLKEREFKHKRTMDILGSVGKGISSLFTFGKGGAVATAKHNDPAFYKNYVKDLDTFTNLTTFVRQGNEFYGGRYQGSIYYSTVDGKRTVSIAHAVPGLACIKWIPSIGNIADNARDIPQMPINQILMRTKEQVLKSNSRSNVPYEAADLGLNFLATGSIMTAIGEFEKILLVCQTYKADNAYYASTLLKGLGISDPGQWVNHLPEARQDLLLLKKRFNSALVAPAGLSLYKKWAYLATLWIKDAETTPNNIYTAMAQLYLQLNNTGDAVEAITPNRNSPALFYDQISTMIQAIAENPDYQAMYADLRSAFSDLLQLDESFDGNASIIESYDHDALEQLANLQTLPVVYTDEASAVSINAASVSVHQTDTGYLYQGLTTADLGIKFSYDTSEQNVSPVMPLDDIKSGQILNFHIDKITGDTILDATRWRIIYESAGAGENVQNFRVTSSDTAVAVCIFITGHTKAPGTFSAHFTYVGTDFINPNTFGDGIAFLQDYSLASSFDWMPLIRYHYINGSTNNIVDNVMSLGNVCHLVPVSSENLKRLNQVCVLSEFYIDTQAFKVSPGK